MSAKNVLFRVAAREKVLRGTSQLAAAVRLTLGPKSKSVLIQKKWNTPIICNDGVKIAKELELEDPEENLGGSDATTGGGEDRRRPRRWANLSAAARKKAKSRPSPPTMMRSSASWWPRLWRRSV